MKAYRYIKRSAIQIIQTEPNEATVEELYVDPDVRGHHVASRLLSATCKDADRENVTLFLRPHPFGGYDIDEEKYYPPSLTYKQLCAFYRTFGFRFRPNPFDDMMMRKPKG